MNVHKTAFALKSILKEVEKDLKEQMKVEDTVPEKKTESLKELLEFTKDEMKKRPNPSKPGKVEKGKKSSKLGDVKKSIEDLKNLISEISTYKAQSPSAIEEGSGINPPSGSPRGEVEAPDLGKVRAEEAMNRADDIASAEAAIPGLRIGVGGGSTGPQMIGGEPNPDELQSPQS